MHVRGEESHWTELYLHVRGAILLVDAEYRLDIPQNSPHEYTTYIHKIHHTSILPMSKCGCDTFDMKHEYQVGSLEFNQITQQGDHR